MAKFLVLYMASPADFQAMMKISTPESQKQAMGAWMAWMQANQAAMVDGGAPLGKTKRVDAAGAADYHNGAGGYSVIQADSAAAAAALFGPDHPHLASMPGGWVEITEIMAMPGM